MKKTLICTFVFLLVAPIASAADQGWPEEMKDVERIVKAKFGDIPYNRVKVRREGNATEVSIKLKNIPRQFRDIPRQEAADEDVYLMTAFNELFEPDFDIFGFDTFPVNNLLTYYYGWVALNTGKTIKRNSEITVVGPDGIEVQNIKKRTKIKKNRAFFRWVEATVSGTGIHLLHTEYGPWTLDNYMCTGCG